jgi:HSP20 family molecular chaperone IbpA
MNTIRGIKLRWLHETLGDVTYQLARLPFSPPGPYRWHPAINAFQCDKGLRICVDLAGVDCPQVDRALSACLTGPNGQRLAPCKS